MASRTRSAFFWRSSSSSPASAPIRASNAARLAIQPARGRGGFGDEPWAHLHRFRLIRQATPGLAADGVPLLTDPCPAYTVS